MFGDKQRSSDGHKYIVKMKKEIIRIVDEKYFDPKLISKMACFGSKSIDIMSYHMLSR